jgi:hypothetical protein
MRGKTFRGAGLLTAWLALTVGLARGEEPYKPGSLVIPFLDSPAPTCVRGQSYAPEYAPADPQLPIPLGSTRPEDGGLYLSTEFMFFRQNNPLKEQVVAIRGFQVSDNSIPGVAPGQFVGSGQVALDVAQLTGADSYQPGFRLGAGWKFSDNSALYVSFFFLTEANYHAGATLAPPGGNVGPALENTFLTSPVFNFPPDFAGPDNKSIQIDQATNTLLATNPSAQAAFGVWNGASIMTLNYIQRFQEWDITYRQTICETEDSRVSGLIGPRFDWLWTTFQWRATSFGDDGTGVITAGPQSTAVYSNVVSNRMYGAHAGCEYECYLGHGFAIQCQLDTALMMDFVRELSRYEFLERFQGLPESKRNKRIYNVVPEVQGVIGMMWYPWEFIQVHVGFQAMMFFNTIDARRPIDFDFSNLDPHYSTTYRLLDGFTAGVAITF